MLLKLSDEKMLYVEWMQWILPIMKGKKIKHMNMSNFALAKKSTLAYMCHGGDNTRFDISG